MVNAQLDRDVIELLKSEKIDERDTYNNVIRRLFDEVEKTRTGQINNVLNDFPDKNLTDNI